MMQPADQHCELPGVIEFREYGPCELADEKRQALYEAREKFRGAWESARGWLSLSFKKGEPCVEAQHFVGLIPFCCDFGKAECEAEGNHLIVIKPKGDRSGGLGGLLRFLELAFLVREQSSGHGYGGERGPEKYIILAHHYRDILRDLCRHDFRRYYRLEEGERLGSIRGRLHVAGHVRNVLAGRAHRIPCRWEEFTPDNWDNRILLGAVRTLERAARELDPGKGAQRVKEMFRPIEPWFSAVEEVPIRPTDFAKARLWRMSAYYRRALVWARLIIQGMSRPGAGNADALVVDANRTFEKWVEVVTRSAALLADPVWEVHFQAGLQPLLHAGGDRAPDITIRAGAGQGAIAIGDAKYKDVLRLAAESDEIRLDEPTSFIHHIGAADWNQLYVYLRLANAMRGFFVVPFWNEAGNPATLLTEENSEGLTFTLGPLGDGVNPKVKVAVLGLNLLRPPGSVRREAADLLGTWLRSADHP